MHEVDAGHRTGDSQVDPHVGRAGLPPSSCGQVGVTMNQRNSGLALPRRLPGAEAVHIDLDQPGKLCRQVFDVYSGAAVDVRRIFTGQQRDPHVFQA